MLVRFAARRAAPSTHADVCTRPPWAQRWERKLAQCGAAPMPAAPVAAAPQVRHTAELVISSRSCCCCGYDAASRRHPRPAPPPSRPLLLGACRTERAATATLHVLSSATRSPPCRARVEPLALLGRPLAFLPAAGWITDTPASETLAPAPPEAQPVPQARRCAAPRVLPATHSLTVHVVRTRYRLPTQAASARSRLLLLLHALRRRRRARKPWCQVSGTRASASALRPACVKLTALCAAPPPAAGAAAGTGRDDDDSGALPVFWRLAVVVRTRVTR